MADAEGQLVLEQVFHIGLLGLGAGFDLFLAGADLVLASREHLELLVHPGAGGAEIGHAQRGVDLFAVDRLALFETLIEVVQEPCGLQLRIGRADHGELVAAPEDMDAELVLYLGEVAVKFAAKIDQQPVVGKLKQRLMRVLRTGRGSDRTKAQ